MKHLTYLFTVLMACICTSALAQQTTVRGQVRDAGQVPLPGVTVTVEDAPGRGTSTNAAGEFTIQVNPGESLRFGFIGYTDVVKPVSANTTFLEVTLEESIAAIDGIVVVGYGTTRRKDVTGSVASVTGDALTKTPALSLNQALQGKAAGVQVTLGDHSPGGGVSVLIRGQGSITQGNDPIYVVDGVIMQGTLGNINVNDIASIDILKDASAAAIYGARAGNGVVLVTTKRGTTGKGKISFSARTSVAKPSNLPKMLTAQQLAEIRIEGHVNSELNGAWYNDPNMTADQYRTMFYDLKKKYGESLPGNMFSDVERQTLLDGKTYDWYDQISRNSLVQDYTLDFSGATEKTNYYLSGNFYDNKGLLKDSEYKRYGLRINIEQKINDWLKVGINSNFTNGDKQYPGTSIGQALGANPMYPFYLTNSKGVVEQPIKLPFHTQSGQSNPMLSRKIRNDETSRRYTANTYLVIDLLPNLYVRSNLAFDVTNNFNGYYVPTDIDQGIPTKGVGQITRNDWSDVMQENTINYSAVINEKHRIGAMLGNSIEINRHRWSKMYGTGFATNGMGYNNLGAASQFPASQQGSSTTKWTSASFIGRLNYTFDDRYLITFTGRYDGNSKFGNINKGNKWGFFPSFAGAWRISSESFMQEATFIDDLKLRVGWGQLGNSNLGSYASFTQLLPGVTVDSQNKTVNTLLNSDQIMGNPYIKWERQQQVNVGIDFTAFKGRLRFSADAYEKKSKDLIMLTPLPVTTGFLNNYQNLGELQNRGLEFTVGGRIIDREVKWDLDLNWSMNRNKITKLYGGYSERMRDPGDALNAGWWVGEPLGTIYTYEYIGIWGWDSDRKEMDLAKDGVIGGDTYYPGENRLRDLDGKDGINSADRRIVGYTDPKWYGGFSTAVSYKNFTLSANFNYVYGNDVWNRSYHEYTLGAGYGFLNLIEDQMDRWTIDNPGGSVPRANNNNLDRLLVSSRVMQDGSYLRMKTLTLAYDFPSRWLERARISGLSLYVTGDNLFTITNYKGGDPESVSTGYDETYPNGRGVTFGLNITF